MAVVHEVGAPRAQRGGDWPTSLPARSRCAPPPAAKPAAGASAASRTRSLVRMVGDLVGTGLVLSMLVYHGISRKYAK